jgi:hypothetical protein
VLHKAPAGSETKFPLALAYKLPQGGKERTTSGGEVIFRSGGTLAIGLWRDEAAAKQAVKRSEQLIAVAKSRAGPAYTPPSVERRGVATLTWSPPPTSEQSKLVNSCSK